MSTGDNRDAARSPLALAALSGSGPLVLVVLTLTLIGSRNRSAIPTANPDRPASNAKSISAQAGDGIPATDSEVERMALEPLRQFLDDGASLPQGSSKSQILNKIKGVCRSGPSGMFRSHPRHRTDFIASARAFGSKSDP